MKMSAINKKTDVDNLEKYGLTFEDRHKLTAHFIERLKIPVRILDKNELENEIAQFLRKKQCLTLATVNPDGSPHQSILDYVSDGIDIYIASEGGEKFRALEYSNKVSISIGFSDGTVESEYGLTIDGTARTYKAPGPKYVAGMMKLKNFVMDWSASIQPMENILSKAINAKLIVATPQRMTYMNIPDGIPLSKWEREEC